MWTNYEVSITVDRLVAGIPANGRMLDAWLAAKATRMKKLGLPAELADVPTTPEEARAEHAATIEQLDPEETHGVVFYRDQDGEPCYEGRCFKGGLKEAANIRKDDLKVKAFRSKLAERVFVKPKLVRITSEVYFDERPLNAMTMQGPRTSIKRFEFAEDVKLSFRLKVLEDGVVTEEHLRDLLEYMQENGIGADRSQGNGTFEIVSFAAI